jgi:hypothetical protein
MPHRSPVYDLIARRHREHAAPTKLSQHSTGRTHDHRSSCVKETAEPPYPWIEHQPTGSSDAAQDRPMRHEAPRVAAAPQRATHDALPRRHGCRRSSFTGGISPVGSTGPRQRGQSHHARSQAANRSGTISAPRRWHPMTRLMAGYLVARWVGWPWVRRNRHRRGRDSGGRKAMGLHRHSRSLPPGTAGYRWARHSDSSVGTGAGRCISHATATGWR